jgi:hypothetical protein
MQVLGDFSSPFFEFTMSIKKFRSATLASAILCAAALSACGGSEQEKEVNPVNETVTLPSNQGYELTSSADKNYQASVTANGPVTIYWEGSPNCTEAPISVRNYGKTCRLNEGGKFFVLNDGLATVTITVSFKALN